MNEKIIEFEKTIKKFDEMIKKSWTYAKMTELEQLNWQETLTNFERNNDNKVLIKLSERTLWLILNNMYSSFLNALNYFPCWREDEDYVIVNIQGSKIMTHSTNFENAKKLAKTYIKNTNSNFYVLKAKTSEKIYI
jgi:hypothetical protein